MTTEMIITLSALGVAIVGGIITIIVSLVRGDMKKFIEAKMVEAEQSKLSGADKLAFVLNAVKEKYKIMELVLNVRKFIEHIIDLSKKIN